MMQRVLAIDGVNQSMVTASIDSNLTLGLCFNFDEVGNPYYLVYNGGANATNQREGVTPSLTGQVTGFSITNSSVSGQSRLAGVPVVTISAGNYGFIRGRGFARLTAPSAAMSAGLPIVLSDGGNFSAGSFASAVASAVSSGFTGQVCGYNLSLSTAAAGSIDAFFQGIY